MQGNATTEKEAVREFWEAAACGETAYAIGDSEMTRLNSQAEMRYLLEPYLKPFARFSEVRGKDVLEVGVGMGADHLELARAGPKSISGIDLTLRAVQLTQARLGHAGYHSELRVADAETLPFADESFDVVYSWGVLHHSPNTPEAIRQVFRVLRPGGCARIMIYHKWSITGLMLWVRYALLKAKPFTSMADIYSNHLESPGTKAYTKAEAEDLVRSAGFQTSSVTIQLNHGDLLEGSVGQRHQGPLLSLAKKCWPRNLLKKYASGFGLYLFIDAKKV